MKALLILLATFFVVSFAQSQTAEAYADMGFAKNKLRNYRSAIADYNKAIELDPKFAEVYFFRGIAKSNLEDYRGAIADYNKVIELNPKDADAYYSRGIAKLILATLQGQIDSGCLDLSKAGELGHQSAYLAIRELCK